MNTDNPVVRVVVPPCTVDGGIAASSNWLTVAAGSRGGTGSRNAGSRVAAPSKAWQWACTALIPKRA